MMIVSFTIAGGPVPTSDRLHQNSGQTTAVYVCGHEIVGVLLEARVIDSDEVWVRMVLEDEDAELVQSLERDEGSDT